MKHLINLFRVCGISLAVFFVVGAFAAPAGALNVKKGGEGSEIAADSIKPHDYILMPQNLPCVVHFFNDYMERLKLTQEQKEWIKKLENSSEEKTMRTKAEEIKALEFSLRKKAYTGNTMEKEIAPQLRKIADLRLEHTLKFIEIQNNVLNMLSREQYDELMRIMTEKGI